MLKEMKYLSRLSTRCPSYSLKHRELLDIGTGREERREAMGKGCKKDDRIKQKKKKKEKKQSQKKASQNARERWSST